MRQSSWCSDTAEKAMRFEVVCFNSNGQLNNGFALSQLLNCVLNFDSLLIIGDIIISDVLWTKPWMSKENFNFFIVRYSLTQLTVLNSKLESDHIKYKNMSSQCENCNVPVYSGIQTRDGVFCGELCLEQFYGDLARAKGKPKSEPLVPPESFMAQQFPTSHWLFSNEEKPNHGRGRLGAWRAPQEPPSR